MSRPRRPFGTDLPGRLPATMLKVVAAEMSDAGRLARGKRMHADGAVIDLIVGSGVVNAEVQGSRSEPYVVTLETAPGTGAPSRHDLYAECSCPDDEGYGTTACKHVVATLFALADEVSIDPDILNRWRGGRPHLRVVRDGDELSEPDNEPTGAPLRTRRGAGSTSPVEPVEPVVTTPSVDPVAGVFGSPSATPTFGVVPPLTYRRHPDKTLDALLRSALEELTDNPI